eukprot:7630402-Heterocapsa_arctica.AAC.1
MFLKLKSWLSSSDVVDTYKRSARDLMMIARMPEDRSKTFKNQLNNLQSHIHLYVYTCGAH